MVQEETDRVKGPIKLSDIKCNREFKKMNREVKEYNNDSEMLVHYMVT